LTNLGIFPENPALACLQNYIGKNTTHHAKDWAPEIIGADARICRHQQPVPYAHEREVDLAGMPKGLYFLKFYGEKSLGQGRVLKQEYPIVPPSLP
jgi:hypothetical protein